LIQASSEDTKLNLGEGEPVAVLGRVVDLQPLGQALGLVRREGLVQRSGRRRWRTLRTTFSRLPKKRSTGVG
jgi:uncharacterized ParB-like nuclease family protein